LRKAPSKDLARLGNSGGFDSFIDWSSHDTPGRRPG